MKKTCFVAMPFGTGEEYAGKNRESAFASFNQKKGIRNWKNIHSGEGWKKSLADENKNLASLPLNE